MLKKNIFPSLHLSLTFFTLSYNLPNILEIKVGGLYLQGNINVRRIVSEVSSLFDNPVKYYRSNIIQIYISDQNDIFKD